MIGEVQLSSLGIDDLQVTLVIPFVSSVIFPSIDTRYRDAEREAFSSRFFCAFGFNDTSSGSPDDDLVSGSSVAKYSNGARCFKANRDSTFSGSDVIEVLNRRCQNRQPDNTVHSHINNIGFTSRDLNLDGLAKF